MLAPIFCIFWASFSSAWAVPADCVGDTCLANRGDIFGSEDHERNALGLMQASLHYKLRSQKSETVALENASHSPGQPNSTNLTAMSCMPHLMLLESVNLPMPIATESLVTKQVLEKVGIVPSHPPCARKSHSIQGLSFLVTSSMSINQQNNIAFYVMVAWCALALTLMVWSVWAVVVVPKKKDWDTKKRALADEKAAWERGFFHWVSLSWVDELVGRYGKRWHATIDEADVFQRQPDEQWEPHVDFKRIWQEELDANNGNIEKASLVKACVRMIGWKSLAMLSTVIVIEQITNTLGNVLAIAKISETIERYQEQKLLYPDKPISILEPSLQIVFLVWGMPMFFRFLSIMTTLLDGHYTLRCAAGLATMVFEKCLRHPLGTAEPSKVTMNATADEEAPETQSDPGNVWDPKNLKPNVVQLFNIDIIEVWGGLITHVVYTAIAPFMLLTLLVLTMMQIGKAGIMGALYVIPVFIATVLCQRWNMGWWYKYMAYQDKRMKWLTEALLHIRTIKALAWEKLSFEKLHAAREGELNAAQATVLVGGIQGGILHTLPWGVLVISVMWLLHSQGSIQPHVIIVLQRLIGGILENVGVIASGLGRILAVPNSFARIKRFLATPDKPSDVLREPAPDFSDKAPLVSVRGSFTFIKHQPPALHDLNLMIPRGELVGVIGGVASGKSSLLQALIGELYAVDEAFVEAPHPEKGEVSYCAQVPWIFEGTVRENITLDQPLQNERYYQSIYAAGLTPDLQILPGGDQVTIGSFGVRLSGGQRARVALARAAYQQSKFVVIDDPFASVDAPTGQHIFEELILGPAMRGRTRVVVTQPVPSRLVHFDRLLIMQGGRIVEIGSPSDVMQSKAFRNLQAEIIHDVDDGIEEENAAGCAGEGGTHTAAVLAKNASESCSLTTLRDDEIQDHIEWRTIWWWLKSAGFLNLGYFFGAMVFQHVIQVREYIVIASWIDTKLRDPHMNYDGTFMLRCVTVVGVCCFAMMFSSYATSRVSITSSRELHRTTLSSLMRAPVDKFFDKQPTGRLINRLSLDMRQVDASVTGCFQYIIGFTSGFVISQCVALSVIPRRFFAIVFPIYGFTLYFIYLYRGLAIPMVFHAKFAMSHAQDLHAVVLGQCVSIRSNAMMDSFMRRYNYYSKGVALSNYMISSVARAWVQSRVFLCFGALTAFFAFIGIWTEMPLGTLSLILNLCMHQMSEFEGMSLGFTHMITIFNGLQRIVAYSHIPQEAAYDLPGDVMVRHRARVERAQLVHLKLKHSASGLKGEKSSILVMSGQSPILRASADGISLELVEGSKLSDLAPDCPALQEIMGNYNIVAVNGISKSAELLAQELANPPSVLWLDLWSNEYAEGVRLHLEDVTAGYGSAKSVLHSINVEIEPRMKCGIAGRTGCGKSTTLLCILRLLEPRGGRILLGGRDSSKMGLAALRNMVGLVPQDPAIFEGSWRFNIDPFGEFPDARIWEALQYVQLMPYLRSLRDGIDSQLDRDGSNLSFGQRQLLSLARMVIRQPPVLLLDECTSALDPHTQDAVQKTLLEGFPMTTVIAIAHRVETIMSFDKVVVFDDGRIAEQGTVQEVMKIEQGIFASMVRANNVKHKN
eukprot:TRINITY_DN30352_c4_g1_i1.p1 TRINITY_DN30352_c4_g1~~TRINITY_DN30352_c4_g1_i1.p1  ORF type:complete len:1598 (-),score=247.29 TRINITY_DN30352_c4_g1_i1:213-5006(-)